MTVPLLLRPHPCAIVELIKHTAFAYIVLLLMVDVVQNPGVRFDAPLRPEAKRQKLHPCTPTMQITQISIRKSSNVILYI